MVTFVCPNCGAKDIIGILISDSDVHKCSNCGEKMEKDDSQE